MRPDDMREERDLYDLWTVASRLAREAASLRAALDTAGLHVEAMLASLVQTALERRRDDLSLEISALPSDQPWD